jgi:predicted NBD/HSP70 family sugar kinase
VDSGLLVEGSSGVHTRTGRPSLPLDVQPASRRLIGVKITGDELFAVVTDLRAAVLAEHSQALPARDPDAVIAAVADVTGRMRAEHPDVVGLGIGIGGRVMRRADVTRAHFLGWHETVPLAARLTELTGLPTAVENDVRALTVAEHWFGAGRGLRSLAVVTIGAGVGCGIVVHDRLVEGAHGAGGWVGHRPLAGWGLCADGHRGCAEGVLTIGAITAAVGQALGRPVTYDEVLDLARSGQPAARRVTDEAGRARPARGRRRQPRRPGTGDPHRRRDRARRRGAGAAGRGDGGEPQPGRSPGQPGRAAVPVQRMGARGGRGGGTGPRARARPGLTVARAGVSPSGTARSPRRSPR